MFGKVCVSAHAHQEAAASAIKEAAGGGISRGREGRRRGEEEVRPGNLRHTAFRHARQPSPCSRQHYTILPPENSMLFNLLCNSLAFAQCLEVSCTR